MNDIVIARIMNYSNSLYFNNASFSISNLFKKFNIINIIQKSTLNYKYVKNITAIKTDTIPKRCKILVFSLSKIL